MCAAVLVAGLMLGGGTRSGFLTDVILQLIALPLLLLAVWRIAQSGVRPFGVPVAACCAVVLVPLLQIVPLPPSIWSVLPGREPLAAVLGDVGLTNRWSSLSVGPRATLLGAISLVVPVGVFLATIQLNANQRRVLSLVVLGAGLTGASLGLVQVAQGPASPLRFFEVTNPADAVGFFANRNHFAAMLYALIPFTVAWAMLGPSQVGSELHGASRALPSLIALAGATALILLISAQLMARSRAGIGLTTLALIGGFAVVIGGRRRRDMGVRSLRIVTAATAVAILLATQFALYRAAERFTADPLADARWQIARNTIHAALSFMPFGSGVGTFQAVYGGHETAADLRPAFTNRAHSDLLEVSLESGAVGLALIAAYVAWLCGRSATVWRSAEGGGDLDTALSRAAAMSVSLILLHCLVDYPLRTGALMAFAAFASGLLVGPIGGTTNEARPQSNSDRGAGRLTRPTDQSRPRPPRNFVNGPWPKAWQRRPQ